MASIDTKESQPRINYMARDYRSFRQALIEMIPSKLPEWTDLSEADFGVVLIELFAHLADILSYYQDRMANEAFLATARERRSVVQHLRLIGYEMAHASAAAAGLRVVIAKNRLGTLEVRPGDRFATASGPKREPVSFEYVEAKPLLLDEWVAATTPDGKPWEGYVWSKLVVPVREGRRIEGDVLGTSNGRADQRFPLSQRSMLPGTLQLQVETEPATAPWRLRENLLFSGHPFSEQQLELLRAYSHAGATTAFSRRDDPDFIIETDENDVTSVVFGDGVNGRIPPVGARIVASYRVGGGAQGNVTARTITTIVSAPQLQLAGAKVTNPDPASGGAERESVEHAVRLAPAAFRSMHRAVTADDFVTLALLFPGVAKARAVAESWNLISLYIAPMGSGQPVSDVLRRDLLAYFEDKRMLTTQVEILDPNYPRLQIKVRAKAAAYVSKVAAEADIEATIAALFSFERMSFGQRLYVSKIYEALEALPGVEYLYVESFGTDNGSDAMTGGGTLEFGNSEIPVLGSLELVWEGEQQT